MSVRPAAPPRRAQPATPVVQGRRLDAVLRAGAAVVGTPVAYGRAAQRDARPARSLKAAPLEAATGAPCVPLSFDPDYCKRFDKFYALGMAITSSMLGLIAAKAGEVTFAAMAARLKTTIETECKGMMWAKYFYDTVLPHYGLRSTGRTRLASDYCNDLGAALEATQSNARLSTSLQNSVTSGAPLLAPFVYLSQLFLYLASGGGAGIVTNGYQANGYYQMLNVPMTAAAISLGAGFASILGKKLDQVARGLASYLRVNLRAWAEGGLEGLKNSPYLNPSAFYLMVQYDPGLDDDDEEHPPANPDAQPPALEPAWLLELKDVLAAREAAAIAGVKYN
jgi:hypothetical protein